MPHLPLSFVFPLQLEFLPWWQAASLFAAAGAAILCLGIRSMAGLGSLRKWVAIGARLLVLLLLVLIIAGARWQRPNRDVEVMVLRDVSESTLLVRDFPGPSLHQSIEHYLRQATRQPDKRPGDRIGVISFHSDALIDAMPNITLELGARAIREMGTGTDAASAIQLGLATLGRDALHRLVLIWDGNATAGNIEEAIAAAAAQRVPIDVMPLRYDIQNEILVERFIAPTWKRENEPFSLEVILRSTNPTETFGKLTVLHQGQPMDLDPATPGVQPVRLVRLQPGRNVERVQVPALLEGGVHQFRAIFEGDGGEIVAPGGPRGAGNDTITQNNIADAFTFVRGQGKVLYIDNTPEQAGQVLRQALAREGIAVDAQRLSIDQFPNSLIELQNYDAVILANVPRGAGGLSEEQQRNLASYVHEMGGGLVMIGGEQAFGAGGWQGSRLEEVLPVNMDIPAQRQMPKGALVLIMHSTEMPEGNYWGEQCAIKAIEVLSSRDEIGVISYNWGMGGGSGSQWDFPLQMKGDGTRVLAAVKNMKLGDMPDFDEAMDLALHGSNGAGGLIHSDARQKHVIIISDGDPSAPSGRVMSAYRRARVGVSTVTVYPHMGDRDGLPRVMKDIAAETGGRAYGPINNNPNQLPQIFIKEATTVRRSLIQEDEKGIPLKLPPSTSDMIRGLGAFPPIYGMVLTSRKQNPQIEMPLVAGENNDPVLAHWQTGLGRAAVWTSDAHSRWMANWVATPAYGKFWGQVVRTVARPPMSTDFDVTTRIESGRGKIVVEAINRDSAFINFLSIAGTVVGPNGPANVRLVQTGPGTYEGEFAADQPGSYVAVLNWRAPQGREGLMLSGAAQAASPELRDLQSNDAMLRQVAERTGGRVLPPFDPTRAELFVRQYIDATGTANRLAITASPLPIWDWLLPVVLAMIVVDVAIRRIAWDAESLRRAWMTLASAVRSHTIQKRVETRQTVDALARVREQQAVKAPPKPAGEASPRPDPQFKFQSSKAVDGDISKVVGGATDKPVPPLPRKVEPKGAQPAGDGMSSLMEAKRRAQQKIKEQENQ